MIYNPCTFYLGRYCPVSVQGGIFACKKKGKQKDVHRGTGGIDDECTAVCGRFPL